MSAKDNPIFSYAKIGEELIKGCWGPHAESLEKAVLSLDEAKASRCVLSYLVREQIDFMRSVEPLVTALRSVVDQLVRDRVRAWEDETWKDFAQQIQEREQVHGPCPRDLRRALSGSWQLSSISQIGYFLRNGVVPNYVSPPDKGSVARKEYDRWMKRKAPKKTGIDTDSE